MQQQFITENSVPIVKNVFKNVGPTINNKQLLTELTENQLEGIDKICQYNGNYLLADAPGMGKSLTAIAALLVLNMRDSKPILIIAPQVLHQHWANQVAKFVNDAEAVELEAK